jgi:hypothetical protein
VTDHLSLSRDARALKNKLLDFWQIGSTKKCEFLDLFGCNPKTHTEIKPQFNSNLAVIQGMHRNSSNAIAIQ